MAKLSIAGAFATALVIGLGAGSAAEAICLAPPPPQAGERPWYELDSDLTVIGRVIAIREHGPDFRGKRAWTARVATLSTLKGTSAPAEFDYRFQEPDDPGVEGCPPERQTPVALGQQALFYMYRDGEEVLVFKVSRITGVQAQR